MRSYLVVGPSAGIGEQEVVWASCAESRIHRHCNLGLVGNIKLPPGLIEDLHGDLSLISFMKMM